VVITDASGLYRVPQLPPGSYTLRFEKESYRPYARSGIDVVGDRTLRLNVELLPEVAGSETVTVVGTAPIIDVGSSTVGSTINQDYVHNLAVSRPNGLGGSGAAASISATVSRSTRVGPSSGGVHPPGRQRRQPDQLRPSTHPDLAEQPAELVADGER
jgi:hypothetical protein